MICFPNIKINIALDIISRRDDGYHNIETVFIPIPYKVNKLAIMVILETILKTI